MFMEKYYDYSKKQLLRNYCSSIKKLVLHPSKVINAGKTYYPDAEHKTCWEMFRDQIWHIRKYGVLNPDYYIYGLDVKGTDCSKFIYEKWNVDNLRHQNRKYCGLAHGHDYIVTVADKVLFSQIMQENKFPIPKTYGSLINGALYLNGCGADVFDLSKILESPKHVLFKPVTGNSGKGILSVMVENGKLFLKHQEISLDSFREMTNSGKYLIQYYVENQHRLMKALYDRSLNTMRVTMVRTNERVQLLGCMCLMGGGRS